MSANKQVVSSSVEVSPIKQVVLSPAVSEPIPSHYLRPSSNYGFKYFSPAGNLYMRP